LGNIIGNAVGKLPCQKKIQRGKTQTKNPGHWFSITATTGKNQKHQSQHKRQMNRSVSHLVQQAKSGSINMKKAQADTGHPADHGGKTGQIPKIGFRIVFLDNGLNFGFTDGCVIRSCGKGNSGRIGIVRHVLILFVGLILY